MRPASGAPDYIDGLLGAFLVDPPRIWAGGPTSGRHGGTAAFARFHRLSALDELAWRTRIEGSRGIPEREFNGPVEGCRSATGRAWPASDPSFLSTSPPRTKTSACGPSEGSRRSLYEHCCEGMYGAPEYGGNRGGGGVGGHRLPR